MSAEDGRARVGTVAFLTVLAATLAWSYWYHQSDVFTSIDSSKWYTNGSISASGIGLTGSGVGGGAVISKVGVPYSPANYEVRAKIKLAGSGGGDYILYARASNDAHAWVAGSYYSAEWYGPGCDTAGNCSGWWVLFKRVNNQTPEVLGGVNASTANYTADMRLVMRGTQLYLWMNGVMILTASDSGLASGQPGVGARATPANCSVERVDIGHLDDQAPLPVAFLTASRFPSAIRLRWLAGADPSTVTEDAGTGTGPAQYHVYKNGVWLVSFANGSLPGNLVEWVDVNISPQTTYTYQIKAADYHFNEAAVATVTVQPSAVISGYDARQVGVKANGTYWGAAGENIDMRSGNLNFNLPLVQAQMRGGGGAAVGLSYNSQIWQMVGQTEWRTGRDSGQGLGWRVMIGSVAPVIENGVVLYYVFADATGAEYRLDQNNGGLWTSLEGIYVSYDTNAATPRVWFNDGTFWEMGSLSGGIEEDNGARYPTKIQSSNGNQVLIRYFAGVQAPAGDTSSRIGYIEDVRAVATGGGEYRTYSFYYQDFGGGDPFPHLTSVANHINSGETYSFYYWPTSGSAGYPVTSPFTGALDWRPTRLMNYVVMPERNNATYTIEYASSGEVLSVTQPYGGRTQWAYRNAQYANNYFLREVYSRTLTPKAGTTWTYDLQSMDTTPGKVVRSYSEVVDAGTAARTRFEFYTSGPYTGMMSKEQVKVNPAGTVKSEESTTWALAPGSIPYVQEVKTSYDPAGSNPVSTKSTQTLDSYGNLATQTQYAYGQGSTPGGVIKTVTNTYLTGSNYINAYIRNRLTASTVTDGTGTSTVASLQYDEYGQTDMSLVPRPDPNDPSHQGVAPRQHDSATYGTGYSHRGNPTTSIGGSKVTKIRYDMLGVPAETTAGNSKVAANSDKDHNYAVPARITPNSNGSLAHSMTWNSHLGLTADTGPNNTTSSIAYTYGQPSSTTSVHGVTTGVNYSISGPQKIVRKGTEFVKDYYDGFGRTILTQTGYTSGSSDIAVSQMDTEYGPCACSPMGKVKRVSRPYAGATPQYWTEYQYDQMGRTTAVIQPAGSGSTTYSYEGNAVTVTDPAGKWKKFEMDAAGNLRTVTEPKPSAADPTIPDGTLTTTYEYNERNQLKTVSMGIQTRTFQYYSTGELWKATNPENGTVTYVYDNGLMKEKTDATAQRVVYDYDSYRRVTAIHRYNAGQSAEDQNQLTTFAYGNSGTTNGRLLSVTSKAYVGARTFEERYDYTAGGLVTQKKLIVQANGSSADLAADYGYPTNSDRVKSVKNPNYYVESGGNFTFTAGETMFYSYDGLGQLSKMGSTDGGGEWVSNTTYNVDGTVASMTSAYGTESRTYNVLGQLTGISAPGVSIGYGFPTTGPNNGRIASMTVSGETVTYKYDVLNRLSKATSSGGWEEAYTHDRYGNLGSIGGQSIGIDQSTNRLTQGVYDANGNYRGGAGSWNYDVENRLIEAQGQSQGTQYYGYGGDNKRLWRQFLYNGSTPTEHVYFYGAGGRIGTYEIRWQGSTMRLVAREQNYYFGGKLLRTNGGWVTSDRLGSVVYRSDEGAVRKFRPYGQEYGSSSPNDQTKFGTYHRDNDTGLDYADQRYYVPGVGRFSTPDPYRASGGPADPRSWNRYTYTRGDPLNALDPSGLQDCPASTPTSVTVCGAPGSASGGTGSPNGSLADEMLESDLSFNGGPSSGLFIINNLQKSGKTYDDVWNRLMDIRRDIQEDEKCLKFLNSGGQNAVRTIGDYFSNGLLATGTFERANIAAINSTMGSSISQPGYAAIIVNDVGAYNSSRYRLNRGSIVGGTERAKVFILLHELAHSLEAKDFKSDLDKPSVGDENDKLLSVNCEKTIGKYDK